MKKIILLLLISFSLSGCGIAQTKQAPVYLVFGRINHIVGEEAVIQTNSKISYVIPAASVSEGQGPLMIDKRYKFYLEIVDCGNCLTRKAVVVSYAITPESATQDMNALGEKLGNREIIKGN